VAVTDKDKGLNAIRAELKKLATLRLAVGVVGAPANYQVSKNATLADIATFNEYGTKTIPARSFMRSAFDENVAGYQSFFVKVIPTIGRGNTGKKALSLLGLKMVSDIQRKIVAIRTPANSEATIARKGFDNPLIHTGRLRQSITFEIRGAQEAPKVTP
jgi:hypothetical protein